MVKTIVIVGGGISGLSLLYYLKKKYLDRTDVRIVLLEKNSAAGGNIRTIFQEDALFECGPNGFLANQPAMLELIKELGLNDQLISADPSASRRYLLIQGQLHQVPTSLKSLFKFKPMRLRDKLRILFEPFVSKGNDLEESLDHFVARRFGNACAKYFADPMVSGIYAGNSSHLSVQAAFPKVYEYEQKFGSVIKGVSASRQSETFRGGLKSFQKGMGELIAALCQKAEESLHINEPVKEIIPAAPYFLVVADKEKYTADELFICSSADVAGDLLERLDQDLSAALRSIEYAPLAVVGVALTRTAFEKQPDGFGYLIPSSEKNVVLGVLFESQIFQQRANAQTVLLRVMIGGVRNPQCAQWPDEQLVQTACRELNERFGIKEPAQKTFVMKYPKAIAQYEIQDMKLKNRIHERLSKYGNLFLRSNYLDGVSVNDCVKNAKDLADRSNL